MFVYGLEFLSLLFVILLEVFRTRRLLRDESSLSDLLLLCNICRCYFIQQVSLDFGFPHYYTSLHVLFLDRLD